MSNVILYQPKKLQLKLFCGRRHFVKEMAINDLKNYDNDPNSNTTMYHYVISKDCERL